MANVLNFKSNTVMCESTELTLFSVLFTHRQFFYNMFFVKPIVISIYMKLFTKQQ